MGKNLEIKPKQWRTDGKKAERMLGQTLEMTTKLLPSIWSSHLPAGRITLLKKERTVVSKTSSTTLYSNSQLLCSFMA